MTATPAQDRARAHWGDPPPDWVSALAAACDDRSQSRVAAAIGYSPAVISQILRARYPGDLAKVEASVRGALMAETVACPVLGPIPTHQCLAEQARPFQATNSLRARLYRACRTGCPNFRPTAREIKQC